MPFRTQTKAQRDRIITLARQRSAKVRDEEKIRKEQHRMTRKCNRKVEMERDEVKKQKKQQREEALQNIPIISTLEALEEALDNVPGVTNKRKEASRIQTLRQGSGYHTQDTMKTLHGPGLKFSRTLKGKTFCFYKHEYTVHVTYIQVNKKFCEL